MKCLKILFVSGLLFLFTGVRAQAKSAAEDSGKKLQQFMPGALWYDTEGNLINAHGGGILYVNETYYWFGEKRGKRASEGVNVYSSKDLYNWKYEALALDQAADTTSDIAKGCIMERPKVIYNRKTGK